ncbi:hypothetical protein GCM10009066_19380 [Halarchaeum salinum]|uniref:Uncharacterized protein n=1 Tax=Halarchaeum salinum TaxID=489912 RepID=A0AAV3S7Y5_9EURY
MLRPGGGRPGLLKIVRRCATVTTTAIATALCSASVIAGATLLSSSKWEMVGAAFLGAAGMAALWSVSLV